MASQSRKSRGMRTQKVLADYYAQRGWPFAESTGAGRSGVDVTGMPGLSVEVKARTGFEPVAWLRQADREGGLPFVVFRPNGMGETRVGEWGVLMTVAHHTGLLRSAGYGDSVPLKDQGQDTEHDRGEEDHSEVGLGGSLGLPHALAPSHETEDTK